MSVASFIKRKQAGRQAIRSYSPTMYTRRQIHWTDRMSSWRNCRLLFSYFLCAQLRGRAAGCEEVCTCEPIQTYTKYTHTCIRAHKLIEKCRKFYCVLREKEYTVNSRSLTNNNEPAQETTTNFERARDSQHSCLLLSLSSRCTMRVFKGAYWVCTWAHSHATGRASQNSYRYYFSTAETQKYKWAANSMSGRVYLW